MTDHASGTFAVKMTPLTPEGASKEANLVRMSLDKQFSGDLTATSKGERIADSMAESGAGGYVAMERVTGSLAGRLGSFALQHSGTMTPGAAPQLSVTVVLGSGKERLAGLAGKMTIRIEGKQHFYEFEYTLPDNAAPDKANP